MLNSSIGKICTSENKPANIYTVCMCYVYICMCVFMCMYMCFYVCCVCITVYMSVNKDTGHSVIILSWL